ncbi:hypothetical protein J4221_02330 [Candidatus Pacearchaeota archaeon]|nr:hypothetical protein [Candidatus Pacearchaeota archaeon]
MANEDYLKKLRAYAEGLEVLRDFEKKALDIFPNMTYRKAGETDLAELTTNAVREPIIRTISAYETALSNLYKLFPEIKSSG